MSLSVPETLFLVVGLIAFGGMFVCLGIWLYLGYAKGDQLRELFKNSHPYITMGSGPHTGPQGKIRLVGSIGLVLALPRSFLKNGLVSAQDIDNFPPALRRKLVSLQWTAIVLLIIGVLLGFTAKFKLLD